MNKFWLYIKRKVHKHVKPETLQEEILKEVVILGRIEVNSDFKLNLSGDMNDCIDRLYRLGMIKRLVYMNGRVFIESTKYGEEMYYATLF